MMGFFSSPWVIGVVLLLSVLAIVIGYRLSKPHSRKIRRQQAHINSRVGAQQPAAAQAVAGNQPQPDARSVRDYAWVWTVMLAIAAFAVLYFWVYQDPVWGNALSGASALNTWVWSHWLGILVLAGLLWTIVELNSTDLGGAAHVLRRMLLWGVLALFIGTWILSWFEPTQKTVAASAQRAPVQKLCPDMTTQEKRSCMITSDKWSNWIRMESGARDYSLKPCHSAGVKSERTDVGATKLRFQAVSGEDEVKYQLFPLDTDCFALGF